MLLSESATRAFEDRIQALVSIERWTKSNRDSMVKELDDLIKQVSSEASHFTKSLLDVEIEGTPLLALIVYRELLSTYIQFLKGLREDLDTLKEEDGSSPDYNWITNVIREKIDAFVALDEHIDKHMNLTDLQGVKDL